MPEFKDMNTIPFVMNHGGIGPATSQNIIARKNEISLFLATSKMLLGIDIEGISIIVFVRPFNMMHYILQGKFSTIWTGGSKSFKRGSKLGSG